MLSKLPWSKVLKEAKQRGEVVKLIETDAPVMYKPRIKFDSHPWFEPVGQTYHTGQECYADIA
jgi:hypothetical protein